MRKAAGSNVNWRRAHLAQGQNYDQMAEQDVSITYSSSSSPSSSSGRETSSSSSSSSRVRFRVDMVCEDVYKTDGHGTRIQSRLKGAIGDIET